MRRREDPRRLPAIGAAVLLGSTLLMVLNLMGALSGALRNDPETRTVTAVFADTQQIHTGDPVRIDGLTVGKVDSIEVDTSAGEATVRMRVERDAGPVFANARADIRWRTLLGGAFQVRLERGTAHAGELGERPIPRSRTASQVELEDVLSVNRGTARRGLRALPRELADALADRRVPADALSRLADVAPDASRALDAVRGQVPGSDLPRLVRSGDAVTRALDSSTGELRDVVSGAAATLSTTAARRADLTATFRRSPATLRDVETTLSRLDTTLELADPLLADLRRPAGKVAPTLAAVRPTLVDAERLIDRAKPLVRALRPAASSLRKTSSSALPLVRALRPSIKRLDTKVLPYFAEIDPDTEHSLSQMIGPALGHLGGGAVGQMDQNGHFIRFPATTGNAPLYSLPCQTYLNNPDTARLVACKSLQETLNTLLSYDPLGPTPGSTPRSGSRARP